MIKIISFFSILSVALISCKKDYTCSCQQTYITTGYTQYGVYHPQSTTSSNFKNTYKAKEDVAKTSCKNFERVTINTYGSGESHRTATETVECELY